MNRWTLANVDFHQSVNAAYQSRSLRFAAQSVKRCVEDTAAKWNSFFVSIFYLRVRSINFNTNQIRACVDPRQFIVRLSVRQRPADQRRHSHQRNTCEQWFNMVSTDYMICHTCVIFGQPKVRKTKRIAAMKRMLNPTDARL